MRYLILFGSILFFNCVLSFNLQAQTGLLGDAKPFLHEKRHYIFNLNQIDSLLEVNSSRNKTLTYLLSMKAEVLLKNDKLRASTDAYKRLVDYNPYYFRCYDQLICNLMRLGNPDSADYYRRVYEKTFYETGVLEDRIVIESFDWLNFNVRTVEGFPEVDTTVRYLFFLVHNKDDREIFRYLISPFNEGDSTVRLVLESDSDTVITDVTIEGGTVYSQIRSAVKKELFHRMPKDVCQVPDHLSPKKYAGYDKEMLDEKKLKKTSHALLKKILSGHGDVYEKVAPSFVIEEQSLNNAIRKVQVLSENYDIQKKRNYRHAVSMIFYEDSVKMANSIWIQLSPRRSGWPILDLKFVFVSGVGTDKVVGIDIESTSKYHLLEN